MTRFYYNNKNTNIENSALLTVYCNKQQLFKNNINNHKMSNIPKLTK